MDVLEHLKTYLDMTICLIAVFFSVWGLGFRAVTFPTFEFPEKAPKPFKKVSAI